MTNPLKRLTKKYNLDTPDTYTVQDEHDEYGTFTGTYDECFDYMSDRRKNGYGEYVFRMTNNRIGSTSIYTFSA